MNLIDNFIRRTEEYGDIGRNILAPYFRKTFEILNVESVNSALLYITGLGFYEVHLNGVNITKGYLAPYRSNFDDFVYYDCYDVTDFLCKDKNVLATVLGNGFQNSIASTWDFDKAVWRGAPILSFYLEISYSNGEKQVIISDEETKTADSPIIFNDLHYGEYYDARLEIENWDSIEFDDSNWDSAQKAPNPHGELRLCEVEPVVQRGELKPISIIKYAEGYIYDFGVNDAGICKLSIKGEKGQKILLQHFEKIVDGKPFLNNIKFTPDQRFQEDEYICSGNGEEVHVPKFTYHGFRYVYVAGITEQQATEELLTFLLLSSNIKAIGSFECNDVVVNKIQDATVRSDISNFFYFPTDCPQREKNGWTADASLSVEQMLLNFAPEKSLEEWLKNIYKAIDDIGRVPGIIPTTGWGYEILNGPAWDGVIVNLPYYIYMYRGDKSVFKDLKIPLMRYLTYLYTLLNEDDLVEYGLGDWCQADTVCESAFDTPAIVTNSILTVDIANKAAFIYEVLGMKEQQEYALNLAQKVRISIRNKLYDTNKSIAICKTQTAQAMAIYYNIFESEEKLKAVENLVKLIRENNDFMKVGVLGGRIIFRVLADYGYADLAYNMITRPEFPSYGNWIKRGATTLWELFTLDDTAKGSLNHHFWGDVSAWFYTYLAGIRINPNLNNVKEVNISPCFVEKLDYVKASHKLPSGEITVEWKRVENGISLEINCPQSIKGNIILNGKHTFENGATTKKISNGKHLILCK